MKRRHFVKHTLSAGLAPWFLNGIPLQSFGNISETGLENENILVVIQLNGGNDGLNTIIPVDQYSKYKAARSNIAIEESKLLAIPQDERVKLHPALQKVAQLFQEGKAAIIQDVGYPDPDYSHFRATDIWNTASDSDKHILSGWAGRYLADIHPDFPNGYPNTDFPDPLSIQIGSIINTSLQGPIYPMGMAVANPDFFFQLLEGYQPNPAASLAEQELSFLRQSAAQTNQYAASIKAANSKAGTQTSYPDQYLAYQLKTVARLISGGLKTKFYFVSIGGFDTHDNQTDGSDTSKGEHANLLTMISEAVAAFMADLKQLGVSERVLMMTYSEFGRRIKSNGSAGTDHGAAAPMFLFGEKLNSRVWGDTPLLPSSANENDNIVMQYDFRSVYASILHRWFCTDEATIKQILFKDFQPLSIVPGTECGLITATPLEKENQLQAYPNPFVRDMMVKYRALPGRNLLQIFNNAGQRVFEETQNATHEGIVDLPISLGSNPQGTYFLRWQGASESKTIKLIKI